jgi:hypothetical protein
MTLSYLQENPKNAHDECRGPSNENENENPTNGTAAPFPIVLRHDDVLCPFISME